jgi:hypothetical protein
MHGGHDSGEAEDQALKRSKHGDAMDWTFGAMFRVMRALSTGAGKLSHAGD